MQTTQPHLPLSLCIPTYNRGKRVHSLVLYLRENLLPLTDDVEIIIVNNCSDDDTEARLTPLISERIRLINRAEFLPTAEENMFESLEFCQGEFVWFHGDDEVPCCNTVLYALEQIRADAADLFIFNSRLIDEDGAPLAEHMVPMTGAYFDVSGDNLVRSVGFVFMLAGISNVMFRRTHAQVQLAREIAAIQKIYAHVCWLLECYSAQRTRIVNQPLVFYRHADYALQFEHFKRFAKRSNIGDYYVWGLGCARLLQHLVSKKICAPSTIPMIFEGRRDGTRFNFLHECIHKIFAQVEVAVRTREPRNQIAPEEFYAVRNFIVSCDLFSYDLFDPIEKIYEISQGQRQRTELRRWVKQFHHTHQRHSTDPYRACRRCQRHGFDIYEMPAGWVAIDPNVPEGVANVLAVLDIQAAPPYVWVDQDFNNLAARLAEFRHALVTTQHVAKRQPQEELLQQGRQFLGVAHSAYGQYATHVEITRQTTAPVRLASNLIFNPMRRARNLVRRLAVRLANLDWVKAARQ